MSSILWLSLVMFISPYSYRASACFSLSRSWWILSFNFSSRSVAFSAEISSCFIVTGHLSGLPEVFVSLLKLHLAVHGLVLKVLDLLQDAVSFLGSKSQLGDSFCKGRVSLL